MNNARQKEPSSSPVTNKALRGIGLLAVVLLIGTMGYMFIEDWPLLDAFYMTVITITTVGYGEIRNVDGTGRIFTIILIFMGMGSVAYTAGVMAQAMVEGQLQLALGRRRLGQKIKELKDHYIICGYGRIGRVIIHELKSHGIPLVVVDSNPNLKGGMEHEVIPFIIDDATSEDVLLEAGVERAKGLVAVVLSDADNLFITMTARLLNQNLFILSRADEEATQRKLLRAGANRVVMPYLIGGQKMAQTIIRPAVTDFLEVTVHDKGDRAQDGRAGGRREIPAQWGYVDGFEDQARDECHHCGHPEAERPDDFQPFEPGKNRGGRHLDRIGPHHRAGAIG